MQIYEHALLKLRQFMAKNIVMLVALAAAVITCFFVPIDRE